MHQYQLPLKPFKAEEPNLENYFNNKRILVTGGAGMIGRALIQRLLDADAQVICLDNFVSSNRHDFMKLQAGNRALTLVEQDVCDPFYVDVDIIFNLACPASPTHFLNEGLTSLRTSVLGCWNAISLSQKTSALLVQASTSEVYGDPLVHPQPEDYRGWVNSHGPRAAYDEGKRSTEAMLFHAKKEQGIDYRIARIFNTYGPGMRLDDGRAIANFVISALRGKDIVLYGDGTQTRSFCYIDDLVDGLILLATPHGPCAPVNLGNPEEVTIREVAKLIIELTGGTSRIHHAPALADDPARRCPDITRARELLSWYPKVALTDGLARTIEAFQHKLEPVA